MRIGLLLIATGKYDIFLQPLIDSVDRFFFRNDTVTIYLFTDKKPTLIHSDRINIVVIPIEHKPFPYPTLYRYKYFSEWTGLINTDYVFYCDVDMKFVGQVGREILPDGSGLTAVLHPGFYKGGGSWCEDINSMAFTPKEKQIKYYAGGFQGGKTVVYLTVAAYLAGLIETDEKNGVMAEWHDESHWNCYLSQNRFKELTPSYCYPESWLGLPFIKRILALDKEHAKLRS